MTIRPLPFALALSLAALSPRPSVADDESMLAVGPRAIPAPPAATGPLPEMRSVGLVVGGLTVGGLGVAGAIVGLFLMNATSQKCAYVSNPSGCVYKAGPTLASDMAMQCQVVAVSPCSTERGLGTTVLMVSAPVVAAGLIMAIIGAQPAPRATEQTTGSLAPEVVVGPANGGALRWRF
jgi:hypothetical protein